MHYFMRWEGEISYPFRAGRFTNQLVPIGGKMAAEVVSIIPRQTKPRGRRGVEDYHLLMLS